MTFSPFVKETADRVVKSAIQGYIAAWLIASGTSPDFDRLLTVTNCKAAAVVAVLSLATAFGFKYQGADRNTSQVIRP